MRHTVPIAEPNGPRGHLSVRKNGALTAKKRQAKRAFYNLIEVIGSSTTSWEDAARNAVVKMDMKVENGKVREYRTRVLLSFKYER